MKNLKDYILNLGLFTTVLNATTSATTGNDLSHEMKVYYQDRLIDLAGPLLVHDQFGQKRPIPQGRGKTTEFRAFTKLPKLVTELVEGVTPDGQALDTYTVTATVKQYGGYVCLTDFIMQTAIDPMAEEALKLIAQQGALSMDTVTREIINAGTNVQYGDGTVASRSAITASTKLTVLAIRKAVRTLKRQNAPTINGNYVAIVHPDIAFDLMSDPTWVDWQKYTSPEHMYKNEIGQIAGVRFVETTEAKVFTGEDLASDSTTLLINGAVSANATTAVFDGGTVAANALAGRKILIDGKVYNVASNTASSGTATITLATGEKFAAITDNTVIYPGEAGAAGVDVYSTLVIGEGAYGVTDISGGGLQTIIKQKGSGGTADPLDQRATIGWKAVKTAEILVNEYMVRIETGATA